MGIFPSTLKIKDEEMYYPGWYCLDNVHYAPPIYKNLHINGYSLSKKQEIIDDLSWKHEGKSYCSFGQIVMRNSDRSLNKYTKQNSEINCSSCRGKGHHWKAKIINGNPVNLICKTCNGEG